MTSFLTLTKAPSAGQSIIWPAGYYGLSSTVPVGQANSPSFGSGGIYAGSAWQTEISAANTGFLLSNVNGKPTVVGYALFLTHGSLETGMSPGNYLFQGGGKTAYFIDQLMNDARSKGLKVFWVFNWEDFNALPSNKTGPSGTDPGTVGGAGLTGYGIGPAYLFNNSSLYGAPELGTNGGVANPSNPATSGFYIQLNGGYSLRIDVPDVRQSIVNLHTAIASAYDGDTAFGGIYINSWDVNQPDNGCAAQAVFLTSFQTLSQAIKACYTKSNVFFAGGFAPGFSAGINGQQLTQNLIQGGILGGSSDTGGSNLYANNCLNVTNFSFTNSGGSSSGTFQITQNAYASGLYTILLSTGQVITVTALDPGLNAHFSWTGGPFITGSPTSAATCSYMPANQTDSINAYLGIASPSGGWTPPATPLYSVSPYVGMVQPGDFQSSGISGQVFPVLSAPAQILQQCATAAPSGLGAGMIFFSILLSTPVPPPPVSGFPAALWGNGSDGGVLNQMKNIPLVNVGYPRVYL